MAHTFWLLCLTLSIVLLTEQFVNGERIRISPSTRSGTELLSYIDAERTNFTLIFSRSARILEKFLVINQRTGIVTLNHKISCGIFYNKVFVVLLRSTSIRPPKTHFWRPIIVTIHNRHDCLTSRKKNSQANVNSNNGREEEIYRRESVDSSPFNKSGEKLTNSRKDRLRFNKDDISNHLYMSNIRTKSFESKHFSNRLKRDVYEISTGNKFQNIPKGTDYLSRLKRSTRNNAPKFAKPSERVTVQEDVNVSTLVYTVSASDSDSYLAGTLVYDMKPRGNILSQDFFTIDASTGKITTKALLDRESMAQHQFLVTATDKGNPPLQASMVLTIEVLDVNDHAPVFDEKVYRKNISESKDSGATVLAVRAYDSDDGRNREIKYSIVNHNGNNKVFIIGEHSGIIQVDDYLDREKVASYHLIVKAEDKGKPPMSSTVDVFINLLDENDCTPQFNQTIYQFKVAENSIGETFVGRVNATDCDIGQNQRIRYSIISGNEDQTFQIRMNSGVILVKKPLDYEKNSLYTLNVMAEDSGDIPESSEVLVEIEITDVNDCPPEFVKNEYQFNVVENKAKDAVVGTVEATDCDSDENAQIEFFLKTKKVPFIIGLTSGKIKTTDQLDHEAVKRYRLEVIAQDKGKVPLRKSVTVYIDVDDVNDSPPLFAKTKYNASIDEKYRSRRPFLTVVATDKDTIGQIKYSIKDEPFNCFAINSFGGITKQSSCIFNYKRKKTYYFKVEASDGIQSSSVPIVVHIQDSNDNAPVFTKSRYTGHINENDTSGTIVTKVKATDDDFGKNAEITYSIMGGSNYFKIDPDTGVITNLVKLDREMRQKYRLRVMATDKGEKKLFGYAHVDIKVKDINDNSPEFEKSLYEVELDENVRVGRLVIQMKATDKDEGLNKQISYFLDKNGKKLIYSIYIQNFHSI